MDYSGYMDLYNTCTNINIELQRSITLYNTSVLTAWPQGSFTIHNIILRLCIDQNVLWMDRRSQILDEATENLTKLLDSAIMNNIKAGFDIDNTSFSIALVSPRQENRSDEGILTDWASSRCCLEG